MAPVNPIERRFEAVQPIRRRGDRRYFAFNADVLASLSNTTAGKGRYDRGQYSMTTATDPPDLRPKADSGVPPETDRLQDQPVERWTYRESSNDISTSVGGRASARAKDADALHRISLACLNELSDRSSGPNAHTISLRRPCPTPRRFRRTADYRRHGLNRWPCHRMAHRMPAA